MIDSLLTQLCPSPLLLEPYTQRIVTRQIIETALAKQNILKIICKSSQVRPQYETHKSQYTLHVPETAKTNAQVSIHFLEIQ